MQVRIRFQKQLWITTNQKKIKTTQKYFVGNNSECDCNTTKSHNKPRKNQKQHKNIESVTTPNPIATQQYDFDSNWVQFSPLHPTRLHWNRGHEKQIPEFIFQGFRFNTKIQTVFAEIRPCSAQVLIKEILWSKLDDLKGDKIVLPNSASVHIFSRPNNVFPVRKNRPFKKKNGKIVLNFQNQ